MTGPADVADGLAALGWDEGWADALSATTPPEGSRPGRVSRTHRVGFDVITDGGQVFAVSKGRVRDPLAAPATGDWVVLAEVADVTEPVIVDVLDRRNAVVRRDPADRAAPQVLAANADVVAVCQGADRPINPRRLERQLALAHGSDAEVLLILTKVDLDAAGVAAAELRVAAPGQRLLMTAVTDGTGIAEVDQLVGGRRTLALLGESGAGKSSLVNGVLGHELLATGLVREGDSKGRHTTTRRTLIPLPGGGAIMDTPGVRAVGLWPGSADLASVFAEIDEASERCRFADCQHTGEPGCEVAAGVADGTIDAERLEAWHQLDGELTATSREVEQKGWR